MNARNSKRSRALWFAVIWLASVAALSVVAYAIRAMLTP
ncbi:MAG: DUF2474 family protein [Rhizobiaceae bacterium]